MTSLVYKHTATLALIIWGFIAPAIIMADVPPVETEDEPGIISVSSFNQLLTGYPDSFYWIDVRDRETIAQDGTYVKARIIPIDELSAEVSNLPADKPIIFFCSTGSSAGEAYDLVRAKRPELRTYFLDADLSFNKQPLPQISPPD